MLMEISPTQMKMANPLRGSGWGDQAGQANSIPNYEGGDSFSWDVNTPV